MTFSFKCNTCGQTHEGMPSFGADAPWIYDAIPEHERSARCSLGTDDCVVDEQHFFVRACLEIPVIGHDEPFTWGVWVSLSGASFRTWLEHYDVAHRAHVGPFFGWLSTWLAPYPDTRSLKTMVHLRDHGVRPFVELERTDHPLAREQRDGISKDRVAEIFRLIMHDGGA